MKRRPARRTRGFTLVELLVSLAVFGLVMVSAFSLYGSNQRIYRRGQNQAEAQQNARVALEAASREIRIAGYDPSGVLAGLASPTPIQVATDDTVTFVADLTRDGVLDQVTYGVQGDRLVRQFSSWDGSAFGAPVSSELAGGVDSLELSYFDDTTPNNLLITAPVPSANLGAIRRIRLALTTRDSAVGEAESFPLFVDVRLRN